MRLFLVRHAEAASGDPDELRPLTPAGREHARQVGEQLASTRPDAVVSSPLLRARETADAVARAAGLASAVDERLAPGATPEDVRDVALALGDTVVVVAHQPDCGRAAAVLGDRPEPSFPPGAVLELRL